ncbi:MAG: Hint domain-containing protein, partial [Clostridia bacterium]|nr:Hint domain-containing protein [Clostridia bacterium]
DLATNSYVNYTYNSDGIRTSRAYVNANTKYREDRTYILDGSKIIQESIRISTISSTTNATLYYLYDASGNVQGFIYNNAYYYFQKNLQGDVIRILNDYGTVVVEYTYDAWGKVLTTTGTLASTVGTYNPFRYRSYYYDTETGYYYLQSRYYDPTVGRFLNADKADLIGANGNLQGFNLFAYCNSNPITHTDETGECIYGDEYWIIQFGAHTLRSGQTCRSCNKTVDWVYEAYPQLWTEVMQSNRLMSGHDISQRVLCILAHDNATVASLQGATRAEQQEIYEQEMATALCFVAGTIVKTENGDEAIENVQVGDYVWAQDTETGEVTLKRVVRTFRNETAKLVTVKAGDEVIETTPEHPFYVPDCDEMRGNSTGLGFGWVKAKDLRPGDTLVLLDGSTATVDSVTFATLDKPITVYNFEVEDFHTYFVGMNGLLVHNSNCGEPSNLLEQLALESTQANPAGGKVIMTTLADPRYSGCVKMAQAYYTSIGTIDVHYLYDPVACIYFQYKVK